MTETEHKGVTIKMFDRVGGFQFYEVLDRTINRIQAAGFFNPEVEAPDDVLDRLKESYGRTNSTVS
jgi:hypothetical protein